MGNAFKDWWGSSGFKGHCDLKYRFEKVLKSGGPDWKAKPAGFRSREPQKGDGTGKYKDRRTDRSREGGGQGICIQITRESVTHLNRMVLFEPEWKFPE